MQESDFVIRRCRIRERSLMHSVYVSSPESGVRWAGPAYAATTEILCAHWIAFADLDRGAMRKTVAFHQNLAHVASTRKSRIYNGRYFLYLLYGFIVTR